MTKKIWYAQNVLFYMGGKVVFEWESGVLFFAALSWFVLA